MRLRDSARSTWKREHHKMGKLVTRMLARAMIVTNTKAENIVDRSIEYLVFKIGISPSVRGCLACRVYGECQHWKWTMCVGY